jgi:hypothetical protein
MAKVYWKMRESGVIPNIWTFEMLIWGYSELKQSWKAEEVLHMMQENHLPSEAVGMIKNSSLLRIHHCLNDHFSFNCDDVPVFVGSSRRSI